MACMITLDKLLGACADDSFDDGIRIDTALVPLAGPGGPVKRAVYEAGPTSRIAGGPRPMMPSPR